MCFGWVLSADADERRGDRPARHEDAILEPLAIAAAGLRPTLLRGILRTVLALARARLCESRPKLYPAFENAVRLRRSVPVKKALN